MALYQTAYGVILERTLALSQLNKLIGLVLYMAIPADAVKALEEKLQEEYNRSTTHKV